MEMGEVIIVDTFSLDAAAGAALGADVGVGGGMRPGPADSDSSDDAAALRAAGRPRVVAAARQRPPPVVAGEVSDATDEDCPAYETEAACVFFFRFPYPCPLLGFL